MFGDGRRRHIHTCWCVFINRDKRIIVNVKLLSLLFSYRHFLHGPALLELMYWEQFNTSLKLRLPASSDVSITQAGIEKISACFYVVNKTFCLSSLLQICIPAAKTALNSYFLIVI